LEPQVAELLHAQLKHEVFRESLQVAPNRAIKLLGFNLIELRQIGVQHHFLTANEQSPPLDNLRRYLRI